MKLLLDECVPQDFRHALIGHDVFTVTFKGWSGIKNGKLLAIAAAEGFEALTTTDRGIEFQQNLSQLALSIVIIHASSNDIDDLLPLAPALLEQLKSLPKNSVSHVAP